MAAISKEKYTNRLLAGDVEANGLLEKVDKIWCIVSQDIETKEMFVFHDFPEYDNFELIDPDDSLEYTIPPRNGTLIEGVRFWYLAAHNGSKLIVHNCGSYDKPLLEKFYPKFETPDESWVDTYMQSKMIWHDRPTPKGARGPHGLQAYGCRLGVDKPEIKDWSFMDEFKLHRCIRDVEIQSATYSYLKRERDTVESKLGIDLLGAYPMEDEYRSAVTAQEARGALVDLPHIDWCIKDLDEKLEKLRAKIEPRLPPSIKKHTAKIGRKEMAELLGYRGNVPDEYEDIEEDGVMVKSIVKRYYKPSTNFQRTIKTNQYSGEYFDISEGSTPSPSFVKKKELTDWIKENHPTTKSKDWDIQKEMLEEKVLNKNCYEYFGVKEDTNVICGPHTRVSFMPSTMSQSGIVKEFLITLGWKDAEEWNKKKDPNGGFVKVIEDTEVRWPSTAHSWNQIVLFIKKGGFLVTSPKLTDADYDKLPPGLGENVSHYNTYSHRRRFFSNPEKPKEKGLKANIRPNGRIPCGVNNFGCSTGRGSHKGWVNVAGDGSLYGKESRSTIIAPEGRVLVASDMNSAQLNIAGYYANNESYCKAVSTGEEFKKDEFGTEILHPKTGKPWYIGESGHCVNARAFTIVSEKEWKDAVESQNPELIHNLGIRRKKRAKPGVFATIFGASGKKVASTLGVLESLGNTCKDSFLQKIGLDKVIDILDKMTSKYSRSGGGYIEIPFGYYVWCKSPHARFNYLDQSTEAVCQKWAINYFEREVKRLGLDCFKILEIHDEYLVESAEDVADEVGKLMCESYRKAPIAVWEWHKKHSKWFVGEDLPTFTFNLDGGYSIGKNYYECH